jgi:hypothetical protein
MDLTQRFSSMEDDSDHIDPTVLACWRELEIYIISGHPELKARLLFTRFPSVIIAHSDD